jgi:hypothetical protein
MEMSQGNSLCSYLKQTKMSFFFFCKIGEQEGRTGPVCGVGTSGSGEEVGKGCGKVNMVQILCTYYINGKMIPVETIPGMGGKEIE